MKKALVFEATREGYGIDQIRHPMTVGELKEYLEDFDEDTLFILSHDNRYTFGSISRNYVAMFEKVDTDEWEEADW